MRMDTEDPSPRGWAAGHETKMKRLLPLACTRSCVLEIHAHAQNVQLAISYSSPHPSSGSRKGFHSFSPSSTATSTVLRKQTELYGNPASYQSSLPVLSMAGLAHISAALALFALLFSRGELNMFNVHCMRLWSSSDGFMRITLAVNLYTF